MKSLIENEGDGFKAMTIDALCVVQGIEYNFNGIKVKDVFDNDMDKRIYDALIIKDNSEITVKNIRRLK